ncbi:hypothetical protein LIER_38935 [Lithospermum erythrorhizon]|uniref:Uncharacterized protein n=1 Tax=Lithospermum erythrorhizon TaxID=34254 RepID=A0AAV3Q725_LITER
MRLPFSPFVNDLLTTINRAPRQLLLIGGWLNVTIFEVSCRMCGIEPTVSLFSVLFSVSHKSFQTKFSARAKGNILAGVRPNRVRDSQLHKKWFYARGVCRKVFLAYRLPRKRPGAFPSRRRYGFGGQVERCVALGE